MYTPEHFKETHLERIYALIRDYPFGMLITVNDGVPFANHLPFLYERRDAGSAVLLGHVAKANPQWQHLAAGQPAMAVFQGPHAYVSPGWYGTPGVPTWNYAVVHVHGTARLFTDETEIERLVTRLTAQYEASQPTPWTPERVGERLPKLLGLIVGFEIAVERIEGKFKLSQNRPAEDQRTVAARLTKSGVPLSVAVAKLMAQDPTHES